MTVSDGERAWLVLLAWVIVYDAWAVAEGRETLSQAFARALDSKWRRSATALVWCWLVVHLFTGRRRR
jgi:hypothetical protein